MAEWKEEHHQESVQDGSQKEKGALVDEKGKPLQKKRVRDSMNHGYTVISAYVVITAVIIYALFQVGNHINVILITAGNALHWIGVVLKPLVIGFALAYLLYPLIGFLEKKLKENRVIQRRKIKTRGIAVAIVMVGMILVVTLACSLVISSITKELSVVSMDSFFDLISSVQKSVNSFYVALIQRLNSMNISSSELSQYVKQVGTYIADYVKGIGTNLQGTLNNVTGFFTSFMFAVIFAIYFLLDGDGMMKYWDRVLRAFSSKKFYDSFHVVLKDADGVFSGYIRGQLVDALFMGVVISIVLSLIGVRFSVFIGIFSGIGNLIPYVGPFIAYGFTIAVCLINGDIQKMLIAVVILFIVQTIDGNVVNPKLLSDNIDIHPVLVIACLIIGSAVGGLAGMLFAVPVGAFAKLQFEKLINLLMRSRHIEDHNSSYEEHMPTVKEGRNKE